MEKKKKKLQWPQILSMAFMMLLGAACGAGAVVYLEHFMTEDMSLGQTLIAWGGLLLGFYGALFVQIIIHEAGHLVFGLLSGYRFTSFRIFSILWLKEDGKLRRKKLHLAGTMGQCLMGPPDLVDGRLPVVLYNLGGSLMNMAAGLLFLLLFFIFRGKSIPGTVFLFLAGAGFLCALENGIPMRMGTMDNDGMNALSLGKNKAAMRGFWTQMRANEESTKGVRLKDMPQEWFYVPADEEMKNPMAAAQGYLACCRLMDEKRFREADALMDHLLGIDSGLAGLHRHLMTCDRICCAMLRGSKEDAAALMTKEQRKFHKQMRTFPSVVRTDYLFAVLVEEDKTKGELLLAQFENTAKTYPSPQDIQGERELMAEVLAAQ